MVLADGTTCYANDRLTDILGIDATGLDETLLGVLLGDVPVPLRSAGRDGAADVPRARRETTYRLPDATERVLRVAVTTMEQVVGVGGPAFSSSSTTSPTPGDSSCRCSGPCSTTP